MMPNYLIHAAKLEHFKRAFITKKIFFYFYVIFLTFDA